MENEFVPYQQALDLKDLGFDLPCMGIYNYYEKLEFKGSETQPLFFIGDFYKTHDGYFDFSQTTVVLAPLYQQALKFLVALQDEFKISLDDEGWFIYNLEDDVFIGDEALCELIKTVKRIKNGKKI